MGIKNGKKMGLLGIKNEKIIGLLGIYFEKDVSLPLYLPFLNLIK